MLIKSNKKEDLTNLVLEVICRLVYLGNIYPIIDKRVYNNGNKLVGLEFKEEISKIINLLFKTLKEDIKNHAC